MDGCANCFCSFIFLFLLLLLLSIIVRSTIYKNSIGQNSIIVVVGQKGNECQNPNTNSTKGTHKEQKKQRYCISHHPPLHIIKYVELSIAWPNFSSKQSKNIKKLSV